MAACTTCGHWTGAGEALREVKQAVMGSSSKFASLTTYGPDTPPVVPRDRVKPLEAALKAIMGDRDKTHGEPEDVFAALAALKKVWRKHNKNRKAHGKQHDEAIEGMLLKLARIAQGEPCQMDNYTDVAGYAGNAYELAVAKGKRDALR